MKNHISKIDLLLFVFLMGSIHLVAQVKEIGTPHITNYSRKTTNAGQQNWMIDQDADGIMYFANNEGLLEFNGFDWNLFALPNHSVIRSVKVIDERIYVGGFSEIGYFRRDYSGKLQYTSFIEKLDNKYRDIGDVWKIHHLGNDVVFQSFKYLLFYDGDSFYRIIEAPVLFHFSFTLAGELYVNDIEKGLLRVAPEKLEIMSGFEALKGKQIWGMEFVNDAIMVATSDEGLFLYKDFQLEPCINDAAAYLKKNQIYSLSRLSANRIAFGTIQNGLLICDNDGHIIKKLNRDDGIQNNTILSLKLDKHSNLWLGLDNGIDYLQINSPFSYFGQSDGLSAGYASAKFEDKLYLGTNQGAFVKSWNDLTGINAQGDFQLIAETRGQVWSLQVFDNELICGHNNGFYSIVNGKARNICNKPGGWMLSRVPNKNNYLIGGTYTGFVLFKKINGKWVYTNSVGGFDESARVFEWENDSTIWMSHGLKGIYKIKFSSDYSQVIDFKLYGAKDGLPSDFNLEVGKWDQQLVVTSPQGIYTYNRSNKVFTRDEIKTKLFKDNIPVKLVEDNDRNKWFFTDDNLGVLRYQEDGSYNLITTPFSIVKNSYIKGFQYLNSIDPNNVIFGSDNGFIHYDPSVNKKYNFDFPTFIDQIGFLKSDSVLNQVNIRSSDSGFSDFKNQENHFVFNFAAADFENLSNISFSAKLDGYEKEFDAWTEKRTREYTNLEAGSYTFRVHAKNGFNTISKEAIYSFRILPPWYKTWWAFIGYGLLFLILVWFLVYLAKIQASILKRKEKIEQLRIRRQNENKIKREMLLAEKELIRLKNEKLKVEMLAKDKELANSTLQMIQKNKLLNRLKGELDKMNSKTTDDIIRSQNQALIRRINKEIEDKNQWSVFEEHFEAVHEEFLKRLKEQYPNLSPKEQKLATYLRLNISTKEIALLMNISARGVEIARYRLRRKFNLDRDNNLLEFILNF